MKSEAANSKSSRSASSIGTPPQAVLRLIKNRRTVRSFQRKPVSLAALKRILEAGNWAPFSVYAPQGRRLFALLDTERDAAVEIVRQCPTVVKYMRFQYDTSSYGHEQAWAEKAHDFGQTLGGAPVLIVTVVRVIRQRLPMMHNMAAAWVATENMMIQAAAEGLATGVITFSTPMVQAALVQQLGLASGEWVVANVLNVGYPAETPNRQQRAQELIVIR